MASTAPAVLPLPHTTRSDGRTAALTPQRRRKGKAGLNEPIIYTVGHSNHAPEVFLDLLRRHSIDTLVDTRSQPYSKFVPHFNPEEMKFAVMQAGIRYVFLGKELGGRPESRDCYDAEGHVLYGKVAVSEGFLRGIAKLEKALPTRRMALCCAEENPSDCHRRLLVGRVLTARGLDILHIRADGRLQPESELLAQEAQERGGQQMLFGEEEVPVWRSIRSVSHAKARPNSSDYLKANGIRRLLDIRLNNTSQLASPLPSATIWPTFLRELCGAEYLHEPMLAPTQTMLDAFKKNGGDWEDYETQFLALMREREIETYIKPDVFDVPTVMLCSEATPEHCHRRLVAEYLREKWGGLDIKHL